MAIKTVSNILATHGRHVVPVTIPVQRLHPEEVLAALARVVQWQELYQHAIQYSAGMPAECRSFAVSLPGLVASLGADVLRMQRELHAAFDVQARMDAENADLYRQLAELRQELGLSAEMVGAK